jgi:hypothetical protein
MDSPHGFLEGSSRHDQFRRDNGSLNYGSDNTTVKTWSPAGADVEGCPDYLLVSLFGYACTKFSIFCWTCFCLSLD